MVTKNIKIIIHLLNKISMIFSLFLCLQVKKFPLCGVHIPLARFPILPGTNIDIYQAGGFGLSETCCKPGRFDFFGGWRVHFGFPSSGSVFHTARYSALNLSYSAPKNFILAFRSSVQLDGKLLCCFQDRPSISL